MKRLAAGSICLLLLLAACGGGGGGGGGNANAPVEPGAREIKVNGRSYAFSPNKIDVNAGENIAIVLHSEDQRHDFTIEGRGLVVDVKGGATATGGFRLAKPGTYTFYCSIPGHRAAGMEGTITAS
jgi:plastocyanin